MNLLGTGLAAFLVRLLGTGLTSLRVNFLGCVFGLLCWRLFLVSLLGTGLAAFLSESFRYWADESSCAFSCESFCEPFCGVGGVLAFGL